ncbi:MAG TPA: helix-turn-helix domain-containing protein [Methylocella sp.]|jgi:CRP/FNR family transcriptional regulator
MYAQAVSNTAVNTDFKGFAFFHNPGRQPSSGLTAIGSLQRKAPGEILFAEGDERNSVYEIVRGMVRLVKLLPDGRRQITGFLCAGRLLGLAPEGAHVYTAEAVTEVTLYRYRRAAFDHLVDEVPGFAKRLLTVTSQELRVAQNQMLLLGRKTATEKVASFLLLIAEQHEGEDGEDILLEVDLPMTRSDIADYLGLTIETVSRTLTKLKQDGLIVLLAPNRLKIRDRDLLEELAAGDGDTII